MGEQFRQFLVILLLSKQECDVPNVAPNRAHILWYKHTSNNYKGLKEYIIIKDLKNL